MSQNRSAPKDGDALQMGAFRPHPSWYEEHWLTEERPARPSVIQRLARSFRGAYAKLRWLVGERSTERMPLPEPQDAR